jgi:hypothetical protein
MASMLLMKISHVALAAVLIAGSARAAGGRRCTSDGVPRTRKADAALG